ncbi:MAG TPA: hypothetical protein VGL05_16795 [Kribbella sp.]
MRPSSPSNHLNKRSLLRRPPTLLRSRLLSRALLVGLLLPRLRVLPSSLTTLRPALLPHMRRTVLTSLRPTVRPTVRPALRPVL